MNIKLRYMLTGLTLAFAVLVLTRPVAAIRAGGQEPGVEKGFTLVETGKYTIQVPLGWTVGEETPWGARDIVPGSGPGKIGAMTAGPTRDGWDALYRTSLYFIKREEEGTETPYRTGKTKQGYECMSFEMKNKDGFANRRYTLLKDKKGNALALSIKIPSPKQEKAFEAMFQHMVDTAKLKA